MTAEGCYKMKRIDRDTFVSLIKEYHSKGKLISFIGYEKNRQLIFEWCGIKFPLNRADIILSDGDVMLVMKLKYRLEDVKSKKDREYQQKLVDDEFDFCLVEYKYKEVI